MLFTDAATCVRINLNKGLEDLCTGNFMMMKNKLKKPPDGEFPSYVFWIGRIYITARAVLKAAEFKAIPLKLPWTFFTELQKQNSRILKETKIMQNKPIHH